MPNAQEMIYVYAHAGLGEYVMISLMVKSSLKPEVLSNHDETEGLKMDDLPDIVIHQGDAKYIMAPNRIIVRRELSKTRNAYFTFVFVHATASIISYLNERLSCGEPLHGESPIIELDHRCKTQRRHDTKLFLLTR